MPGWLRVATRASLERIDRVAAGPGLAVVPSPRSSARAELRRARSRSTGLSGAWSAAGASSSVLSSVTHPAYAGTLEVRW